MGQAHLILCYLTPPPIIIPSDSQTLHQQSPLSKNQNKGRVLPKHPFKQCAVLDSENEPGMSKDREPAPPVLPAASVVTLEVQLSGFIVSV